jgi:hypothetical protein
LNLPANEKAHRAERADMLGARHGDCDGADPCVRGRPEEALPLRARGEGVVIFNIVDRRKRIYRWKRIDVIVERTWHDNSWADGDQAPQDDREPDFAAQPDFSAQKGISLADAVTWASSFAVPLTLFLYDEGSSAVPDGFPPSGGNLN